jgi:hypothetical protein
MVSNMSYEIQRKVLDEYIPLSDEYEKLEDVLAGYKVRSFYSRMYGKMTAERQKKFREDKDTLHVPEGLIV